MKAKEYANQFIDAQVKDRPEVLAKILVEFWKETRALATARNASTLSALVNIARQQDEKYRTFASIINNIEPIIKNTGYRLLLKDVSEGLYWAAFENNDFRSELKIPYTLPTL